MKVFVARQRRGGARARLEARAGATDQRGLCTRACRHGNGAKVRNVAVAANDFAALVFMSKREQCPRSRSSDPKSRSSPA